MGFVFFFQFVNYLWNIIKKRLGPRHWGALSTATPFPQMATWTRVGHIDPTLGHLDARIPQMATWKFVAHVDPRLGHLDARTPRQDLRDSASCWEPRVYFWWPKGL